MDLLNLKLLITQKIESNNEVDKIYLEKNGVLIKAKNNKYFKVEIKEIPVEHIPEGYKNDYKEV